MPTNSGTLNAFGVFHGFSFSCCWWWKTSLKAIQKRCFYCSCCYLHTYSYHLYNTYDHRKKQIFFQLLLPFYNIIYIQHIFCLAFILQKQASSHTCSSIQFTNFIILFFNIIMIICFTIIIIIVAFYMLKNTSCCLYAFSFHFFFVAALAFSIFLTRAKILGFNFPPFYP